MSTKKIANPILSIITINYNDKNGLAQTIESVVKQTWQDFEYILIDGGSTDGSKEVIEKYCDHLTYSISEPDKGIYHAMNKGIAAATGEYVLFLNSQDYFKHESVLQEVMPQLNDADIAYADVEVVYEKKRHIVKYPDTLTFQFFLRYNLAHQASFIKRDLFAKYGGYNENLQVVADWKFFVEAICKHQVSYQHLNLVLAYFFANGISSIKESRAIIIKEREDFLRANFAAFLPDYDRFQKQNKLLIVKILKKIRLLPK